MIFKIILTIGICFLSGILYWLGGQEHSNTKIRDLGVPIFCVLPIVLMLGLIHSWQSSVALLFSTFLLFGSLTTYWKKKGTDAKWYNWSFTGFAYALSITPLVWVDHLWLGGIIRLVVLTGLTCLWSEKIGDDFYEEAGRGFLISTTLPLLLIH